MTIIVQDPLLEGNDINKTQTGHSQSHVLQLDGGFVTPDSNAFGHAFRNYESESERRAGVQEFYRLNHINQTYDYKMHADLGKVLLHPNFGGEPQWAVVGDTFPLGCPFSETIVHHEFFKDNPDFDNPKYNSKNGVYSEKCGLDNVLMSWGHDEYMYLVAKMNNTTLPPAALFVIRFHSFYPLHREGAYMHLLNDEDKEMLKWVKIFNKYDLYSKSKVRIDVEEVKPYYQSLIDKYFPSKLRW